MTKRPVLLAIIALNLAALLALAFVYPQLMVSPGPLVKGHEALTGDCFACHAPLRGASAPRCVGCHVVADVGLRTTKGVPIATVTVRASFHQALTEQDCMACHSDHQGPRLTKRSRKPFSHALLQNSVRDRCSSCHGAPKDSVHRDLKVECGRCHRNTAWQPAQFDHALLGATERDRCEACHSAPTDRLHRQIRGDCGSCHGTQAWKPATFDHDKSFVLDRDHQTSCETCHRNNDYGRYTCYGCHEHSQAKVRAEHLEEGIRDFENCVECHRDPRVEPEKQGAGRHREKERD